MMGRNVQEFRKLGKETKRNKKQEKKDNERGRKNKRNKEKENDKKGARVDVKTGWVEGGVPLSAMQVCDIA